MKIIVVQMSILLTERIKIPHAGRAIVCNFSQDK
jgi:hypothetical protein